jgi:hypothetical protein
MNRMCNTSYVTRAGTRWVCKSPRGHGGAGHYFIRAAERTLLQRILFSLFR